MKLCLTFLLVLMILASVTGEKLSEQTLRRAARKNKGPRCWVGRVHCTYHKDCCPSVCCFKGRCKPQSWGCWSGPT
uniref:Iota-conotoxin-like R11.3 n=1 Tax=Conus radiatus TaxID=61198 RepID=I1B3_CONRA